MDKRADLCVRAINCDESTHLTGAGMVWKSNIGNGPQWLSAGFIYAPWYGMDLHLAQAEEIALQVETRAKALAGDDLGGRRRFRGRLRFAHSWHSC